MKLKNIKGLTLVEILVSIVIVGLALTYGINLFIASWRLESDSADYHMALNYVANVVEHARALRNVNDLVTGENKDDIRDLILNDYKNVTLPSGTKITISLVRHGRLKNFKIDAENNVSYDTDGTTPKYDGFMGILPISVIATWYPNNDKNKKQEKVAINTYIGSNDTFEYFKYSTNTYVDGDGNVISVDKDGNIITTS